ncbi:MAG: hypothetical protein HGA19_02480 [Oscillochloris sp.]|nr:hypothetical protein [Oscillochloris sp.]
MSDPNQADSHHSFSLGGLGAGEYDTSLGQPTPDELHLPRTALLAFRKSGGLRFTSRTVVIYRDGWVVQVERGAQTRLCHLDIDQLDRLNHLALRGRLARHKATGAPQPPDGYVYEIAARIGGYMRRAEVMAQRMPADLAPLIRALNRLR